ncbi:matrixin family metalloprotease [Clostridium thermarum]|uniref:matrixin family metalloprotease n=1 Tax=Clostridium thermarum TaxID=1716543 RepID=UPI001123A642|nr:matrixin family metalloprotease [Clostridium thermarum]
MKLTKTDYSDYEIRVHGCTYDQLKPLFPQLKTNNTGLCVYPSSLPTIGYYNLNGSGYTVTVYKPQGVVNVAIVEQSRTLNGYKKTATHELGHALGWRGHSSSTTDIMYESASTITELTTRDKEHLMQIYRGG